MPVPSQGHYGFQSFPVVDWFCLFIYLWVLTFPLQDCSEFGNFVITLIMHTVILSNFFLFWIYKTYFTLEVKQQTVIRVYYQGDDLTLQYSWQNVINCVDHHCGQYNHVPSFWLSIICILCWTYIEFSSYRLMQRT